MEITLEKVDQVRERTGVSYAKAKETLEHTKGDVLDAIILLEDEMKNENSSNDKWQEIILHKLLKNLRYGLKNLLTREIYLE